MKNNKNNERIIPISNEGKQFFIYFTGNTYVDEDIKGNKIEREEVFYLDEDLNKFVMNGNRYMIKNKYIHEKLSGPCNLVLGPHSPEIETYTGKYVPNTESHTIGLWEKPSFEELMKYHRILEKQNEERAYFHLSR